MSAPRVSIYDVIGNPLADALVLFAERYAACDDDDITAINEMWDGITAALATPPAVGDVVAVVLDAVSDSVHDAIPDMGERDRVRDAVSEAIQEHVAHTFGTTAAVPTEAPVWVRDAAELASIQRVAERAYTDGETLLTDADVMADILTRCRVAPEVG